MDLVVLVVGHLRDASVGMVRLWHAEGATDRVCPSPGGGAPLPGVDAQIIGPSFGQWRDTADASALPL